MNGTEKEILIQKWLTGSLSASEQQRFELLQPSPSEIDQIRKIWELSEAYEPSVVPDMEQAWSKIAQNIDTPQTRTTRPKSTRHSLYHMVWKVAAVAVLLFGLAFFWYNTQNTAYNTLIADQNNTSIELEDGSKLWLTKGSRIQFPEHFSSKRRKVKLTGRAFFDIQKDSKPFIIETPNAQVRVLGTSFEVDTDLDHTAVTVATGRVALQSKRSGKEVQLQAYQKANYRVDARQISVEKSNYLNELAWHTGKLHFENTPLSEVLNTLSEHFSTEITMENKALAGCPFTSPLLVPELQKTLRVLAKTFDMTVMSKDGEGFLLQGGQCR